MIYFFEEDRWELYDLKSTLRNERLVRKKTTTLSLGSNLKQWWKDGRLPTFAFKPFIAKGNNLIIGGDIEVDDDSGHEFERLSTRLWSAQETDSSAAGISGRTWAGLDPNTGEIDSKIGRLCRALSSAKFAPQTELCIASRTMPKKGIS